MGLKKSTGRGTRVKHSTGLEWDELVRAKKHYAPIKYATGENSPVRHSTGTEFDYKVLAGLMRGEGEELVPPKPNTKDNPKIHGIPDKAQEDTTYLDMYLQSRVDAARGERGGRLTSGVRDARGLVSESEGRVVHPGSGSRVQGMPPDPEAQPLGE
ncbi:MAG: hypothetical protein ACE5Q6_23320, partial [Dehalococcoidia bacterium]